MVYIFFVQYRPHTDTECQIVTSHVWIVSYLNREPKEQPQIFGLTAAQRMSTPQWLLRNVLFWSIFKDLLWKTSVIIFNYLGKKTEGESEMDVLQRDSSRCFLLHELRVQNMVQSWGSNWCNCSSYVHNGTEDSLPSTPEPTLAKEGATAILRWTGPPLLSRIFLFHLQLYPILSTIA